jgi:cysteine synthase A
MAPQSTSVILDTYWPHLIRLSDNLRALSFPLMKAFPAAHCVARALERGDLKPGNLVVETSSGTMALGLAVVCRLMEFPLAIVSDSACDEPLRRRMEDLGATVERVSITSGGNYQAARLNRVREICESTPGSWWVNQYDNPSNAEAYVPIAQDLMRAPGRIDCLVGAVGSGGSMSGLARCLRRRFPSMRVVGVDTGGSVLFGQPEAPRPLRGLGNSLVPRNLDHTQFDEIHWVSAAEAYTATRLLHQQTTLYRGGTSGACWMVASHWARLHAESQTICVFPDEGHRYAESIYNDDYLHRNSLWLGCLPAVPVEAPDPGAVTTRWSSFQWARRTLADVTASVHSMVS